MTNNYDNVAIDIVKAHAQIDADNSDISNFYNKVSLSRQIFDRFLLKFSYYDKLIDSGFIRSWFNEFNNYWTRCLHLRPLKFHDFFYLYSLYRQKFQNVKLSDNLSEYLETWQHPENIYSLFYYVYKYSLNPYSTLRIKKFIYNNQTILEYGCGYAPYTSSMIRMRYRNMKYTVADIPTHIYHYTKWRLKQFDVNFINIESQKLPLFSDRFDVIILTTVFEHLPNPLTVCKHLYLHLNPGGYFVFDYIKSNAEGLDTSQAVLQREKVLDYIEDKYNIVMGEIIHNKGMGLTVAQKI